MATNAEKAAVKKYQQKQDNIMIRPSKDEGAIIREAAKVAGMSVQKYILETLRLRWENGLIVDDKTKAE